MARTAEGEQITRRHMADQFAIRRETLADFSELFPGWSLDDPGSFSDVAQAGAILATDRHRTSAGVGADYFERFRRAEGASGSASARLADPPTRDEIAELIRANGLAGAVNARRRGRSTREAMRNALVRASGVVSTTALNGGRHTVERSIQGDRQAQGWQRVTGGNPCAFCAMLASRGPAYRGQASAGFQAHSHCQCAAEPTYPGSRPTPDAQRFREQFDEAQRQAREAGELQRGTANDALNAFRRFTGKT